MEWIHGIVVVFLIVIWGDVNGQIISPYQATLRLYDNVYGTGSGGNSNLCNGAIVHEQYILTTADCLHSRVRSANISRPLHPSTLYVVAGSFFNNPGNTRYVDSIYVHEKYNFMTLENNIAVVKLQEPFPLKNNTAIQWIQLDGMNGRHENCFVSFHNQTSPNYPFASPQSTYVMDNWFCNKNLSATNSTERNDHICSHYILNDTNMCKLQLSQFQMSSDRGTPLVCNNHLSGLLSEILPPQNTSNPSASCEVTLKTWAFYIKVAYYAEWIHQTIARQQPVQGPQQPVVTPPPYSTPPHIQPQLTTTDIPGQKSKPNEANRVTKTMVNIIPLSCFVYFICKYLHY